MHQAGPNLLRATNLRPSQTHWLPPKLVVAMSLGQLHHVLPYLETLTIQALIEKYDG